ncbi:MAG: ATP-binding protein, partial [Candidatus Micrarchaeota archaeon]
DIANVVQEAVNIAAKEASTIGSIIPITNTHINRVLNSVKPSTSIAALDEYEQFRLDFERRVGGKEETKPREKIVTWQDVAGLKNVKKALLETIELPLLHEEMMKDYGVKPSKGILLFGPPGTGKTLIVKAACNELKASFQSLSGAEIMKKGYTKAVEVVRETFNRARENTPAIIFVDEIETFAPARGQAGGSEIIGQFLTEMDGLKELKNVVVIAATNRPAILDSAILRPGRFDKIFYIPPPDGPTREELFKIHLGKFATGVTLKSVALITPGFTGADIASLCQEAKMTSLRHKLSGNELEINDKLLVKIIKTRRPSVTKQLLIEYEDFLKAYGERGGAEDESDYEENETDQGNKHMYR